MCVASLEEHVSAFDATEFLFGRLDESNKKAFASHFKSCDECHRKLALIMYLHGVPSENIKVLLA